MWNPRVIPTTEDQWTEQRLRASDFCKQDWNIISRLLFLHYGMLYINSLLWKYKYFFYCPILPGTYPSLSRFFSCRKEWRHFSFCTKGWPATLLINSSNPCRLSSMKSGSNIPSSFANIDSCFPNALPGSSWIYWEICKGVYVLHMYVHYSN